MTTAADQAVLRSLAVLVTRGTSNNLFQVATLVRAATALGARVDVLFRGDALAKLAADRVDVSEWAPVYASVQADLEGRLRAAEFVDMESFLRDAKQHGDEVRFWASAESLSDLGLDYRRLISLIDGAISMTDFDEASHEADAILTF